MRLLVTIGTDGPTNWVKTPDGRRRNLGSVPVLRFVTKLALNSREARNALDGFLRGEEVMLRVDEALMGELLAPLRRRWAAMDSFIPRDQRRRGAETMDVIEKDLGTLEQHVQALHKAASSGASAAKMAEGVDILKELAQATLHRRLASERVAVQLPSEEDGGKPGYDEDFKAGYAAGKAAYKKNDQVSGVDADKAYKRVSRKHGLWWKDGYKAAIDVARGMTGTSGAQIAKKLKLASKAPSKKDLASWWNFQKKNEPGFQKATAKKLGLSSTDPDKWTDEDVKALGEFYQRGGQDKTAGRTKLTYDVYKANAATVEDILDKMAAVNDKIDSIGERPGFRADRARADIHAVTAKVAGITADVDLTVPWVASDLKKLAARADSLHRLFFPEK